MRFTTSNNLTAKKISFAMIAMFATSWTARLVLVVLSAACGTHCPEWIAAARILGFASVAQHQCGLPKEVGRAEKWVFRGIPDFTVEHNPAVFAGMAAAEATGFRDIKTIGKTAWCARYQDITRGEF